MKRKSPDADALGGHLCFAVYSTGLAFNRVYKPILDRLGLTYPQYLAMVILRGEDGQTVGELGDQLFLDSSTLTPLIKRLEAAGLVTRRRDSEDERVVRVTLTDKGRAVAEEAKCVPGEVLAATGRTPEQLGVLERAIVQLRDTLRANAA
ncbi:MarR family winged helix-turn-helix transcriptional regulator [Sphingomonas quercus]|uniref:MarR family winged helix-turn-helix transcriptional regulator n=1 Tax=Sphingomonas quercus TaxID=2842451 RepID=UPI00342CBE9C